MGSFGHALAHEFSSSRELRGVVPNQEAHQDIRVDCDHGKAFARLLRAEALCGISVQSTVDVVL